MKTKKIRISIKTRYGAFTVILEPEPDMGGYMIIVPKRPDVISWGKTKSHSRQMAKEAIECSIIGDIIIAAEKEGVIAIRDKRPHTLA